MNQKKKYNISDKIDLINNNNLSTLYRLQQKSNKTNFKKKFMNQTEEPKQM